MARIGFAGKILLTTLFFLASPVFAQENTITTYTKVGIDCQATGRTLLFSTENGTRRFMPIFAVAHLSLRAGHSTVGIGSIQGESGTDCTAGAAEVLVGYSSFNTDMSATNRYQYSTVLTDAHESLAPNSSVCLHISTAFTGTTCTMEITVGGIYQ